MSAEAPKHRTEEALRKHAEKAFSSADQKCQALCRDLRKADAELERLESEGGHAKKIEELKARIVAITRERQNLGCGDCPLP